MNKTNITQKLKYKFFLDEYNFRRLWVSDLQTTSKDQTISHFKNNKLSIIR